MSDDLVHGTDAEMSYYHTIRTSLPAFDQARLNTAIGGLTVCSALLVAALTAIGYVGPDITSCMYGFHCAIQLRFLIAAFVFFISAITSWNFYIKVSMFSSFIKVAVRLSQEIERKIVSNEDLRFTIALNKSHPHAGSGGDRLFISSLIIIAFGAFIGVIFSIWQAISSAKIC